MAPQAEAVTWEGVLSGVTDGVGRGGGPGCRRTWGKGSGDRHCDLLDCNLGPGQLSLSLSGALVSPKAGLGLPVPADS